MTILADVVIQLDSLAPSIVVGVIGLWIAWRQYFLHKQKLQLDRFDKRYEVVHHVAEFFARANEGPIDNGAIFELSQARNKARFLFNRETTDFLTRIWNVAFDIRRLNRKLFGPGSIPVGHPQRAGVSEEEANLHEWLFGEGQREIYRLFEACMRFRD